MKYIEKFFTANPDLMIAAFVILFGMLIGMVILHYIARTQAKSYYLRLTKEEQRSDYWRVGYLQSCEESNENGKKVFDLTCRLADAEQIINALNGRVIKIRDEKTQQFVSYHDIKNKILQYENKYYKKK